MDKKQITAKHHIFLFFAIFAVVIFLFYPFFKKADFSMNSFITQVFFTQDTSLDQNTGNVYEVKIASNVIEPHKIYIREYDVLHFLNSTNNTVFIEYPSDINLKINAGSDLFKRFNQPGKIEYIVKNGSNNLVLQGTIYVK